MQSIYYLFTGVLLGGILGFTIGYIIKARSKSNNDSSLKLVMVFSSFVMMLYIVFTVAAKQEPNPLVCLGILASGYGGTGGVILERMLEKKPSEKSN